jgi:hypothetical protein
MCKRNTDQHGNKTGKLNNYRGEKCDLFSACNGQHKSESSPGSTHPPSKNPLLLLKKGRLYIKNIKRRQISPV